jgi:hypothetical protein
MIGGGDICFNLLSIPTSLEMVLTSSICGSLMEEIYEDDRTHSA